ncbi:AI-2E family transporter [Vagococcus xieshaowenii]|uniref:AI-2E family transporter n=1 Tax=Vagococcus xieshaowenii TaxID=2562451 RepID=A0AAJ5EE48_9ENTE|nr:AI-2E family transporter [Vagococcus xieshaowenii]QCA29118.1 AI-2E family transporter [Vagococcus xieshaowenii]TFZ40906.1 AI-2E family transporter [Vagococcus xieshaowenii]
MFEKMKNSKLMFWSLELLILAALIFVSTKIDFLFSPIFTFVSTLFAPILIAGFLFYILNPIVGVLEKKVKIKRIWAIIIVLILLVGILALSIGILLPALLNQIKALVENLPQFINSIEDWTNKLLAHPKLQGLDVSQTLEKLNIDFGTMAKKFVDNLYAGVGSIIGKFVGAALLIITVPFILFYMLKDGHRLMPNIKRLMPENYRDEMSDLLGKMNQTISKYISGQTIECLFVGAATAIGYALLGVDYAILFGTIAGITNMIPYLGPYLGLAPAVIATLFSGQEDAVLKAILCCVLVLVVQQIDGNIIYPNIIGKSLDIHPLTIIIILLVAGNIAGLIGMILGVPFYAIVKTIVVHIYHMIKLNQKEKSLLEIKEGESPQR